MALIHHVRENIPYLHGNVFDEFWQYPLFESNYAHEVFQSYWCVALDDNTGQNAQKKEIGSSFSAFAR